ncbi:fatty acid-binding protein, intestinal [Corvus cornix cornix]|nr:fatty acid-binding protein, intestinal [Corvus cornix cornix]XP_031964113.1 fatty acid-binding protein, intestinal [Corvus moneduloides]XP_041904419.1 fatty acid-binding protein, intestinal [Corvus kubaryi]XP_048159604.1 fatty acid-binding protein, intestinal [Corvus hawaiiensis]NWY22109.1 FABPI protein [Aphelocoma coerulescens]NXD58886.1 FABPI protein [Corvus moneduloides]
MAFDGTWKIDRNENYEKFMEAMGIGMMKRKLGAHDNLKITIQQDGNKFTVKEASNFRNIEIEFTLGVNFEYSLADGTELSGAWNLEGNKLVGTFTRKDNGKVLKAYREIVGDELVQTYVYEGVESKRFFKRG